MVRVVVVVVVGSNSRLLIGRLGRTGFSISARQRLPIGLRYWASFVFCFVLFCFWLGFTEFCLTEFCRRPAADRAASGKRTTHTKSSWSLFYLKKKYSKPKSLKRESLFLSLSLSLCGPGQKPRGPSHKKRRRRRLARRRDASAAAAAAFYF